MKEMLTLWSGNLARLVEVDICLFFTFWCNTYITKFLSVKNHFHDFWLQNNHYTIQSHIVIKCIGGQYEKQKLPLTSRTLRTVTWDLVCHIPLKIKK